MGPLHVSLMRVREHALRLATVLSVPHSLDKCLLCQGSLSTSDGQSVGMTVLHVPYCPRYLRFERAPIRQVMAPLHVSLMRVREHALRLSISIADWEEASPTPKPQTQNHKP